LRKDSCARTPLFDFREWEPPAKIEAPAPEHVNAVIAAADAAARGPIILAATAGLRRGEVFALRWVDLDFEKRLIRVRASNRDGVTQ